VSSVSVGESSLSGAQQAALAQLLLQQQAQQQQTSNSLAQAGQQLGLCLQQCGNDVIGLQRQCAITCQTTYNNVLSKYGNLTPAQQAVLAQQQQQLAQVAAQTQAQEQQQQAQLAQVLTQSQSETQSALHAKLAAATAQLSLCTQHCTFTNGAQQAACVQSCQATFQLLVQQAQDGAQHDYASMETVVQQVTASSGGSSHAYAVAIAGR
jgi:hypothetical protein